MLSCASSQQYELSGLSSWHANRPCRGVSLRKHSSSEKRQVAHLVKAIRVRNVQRQKHLTVSLLATYGMRRNITMAVTITENDAHLQELIGIAGLASRTLKREKRSLGDYVGERNSDSKVILKYEGASIDPGDATDHMTSTAFFLSRLQRSSSVVPDRLSSTFDFAGKVTLQELSITLESDFNHLYGSIPSDSTIKLVHGNYMKEWGCSERSQLATHSTVLLFTCAD